MRTVKGRPPSGPGKEGALARVEPRTAARPGWLLVGVGLVSASTLGFEVALTRVFAVAQAHHLAFFVVAVALLGFGASGSALALAPRLGTGGPRRWASYAVLQATATVGSYLFVATLPFDVYVIGADPARLGHLAFSFVVLAVPFFFGGLTIGAMLSAAAPSSRIVYGASLVGAGTGCGSVLAVGGSAAGWGVALATIIALAGAVSLSSAAGDRPRVIMSVVITVMMVGAFVLVPGATEPRFADDKSLVEVLRDPNAEIVGTWWSGGTRVDHVRGAAIRSFPGLSFAYDGPLPPQDALFFNGADMSPITRVDAAGAGFAGHMLTALPYALHDGADALVLEPRGGLDVLVALANGSASVVAVEPEGAAIAAVRRVEPSVYLDDRVELVEATARAFAATSPRRFDVVQLALTTGFRAVTPGAYSMAEDYRYTVEAMTAYMGMLEPGGMLAAMRWLQVAPSEETKLIATAAEAVRRTGGVPASSIVAVRGHNVLILLVAPDGLDAGALAAVRDFTEERRFDLVALPGGVAASEANRFSIIADDPFRDLVRSLLQVETPWQTYAASTFRIEPATDERPFFDHYFRWGQSADVVDAIGRAWGPFGGAGYFVPLAFVALAGAAAALLILAPLVRLRISAVADTGTRRWTAAYFVLTAVGFLFVEIALVSRYLLAVDEPAVAVGIVLFGLLGSAGMGSMVSARIPWRAAAWLLTGAVVVYAAGVAAVSGLLLELSPGLRAVAGTLVPAPLGFLMGAMFPKGIAHLEGRAPGLVPWAWAVSGTASVVAATATIVVALGAGLNDVMLLGATAYGFAALLASPASATEGPGRLRPSRRSA